jgi:hypothetical protein
LFYFRNRDDQKRIDEFRCELIMIPVSNERYEQIIRSINSLLLAATYGANNYNAFIDININQNKSIRFNFSDGEMDNIWSSFNEIFNDINTFNRLSSSKRINKVPLTRNFIKKLNDFNDNLIFQIKQSELKDKLKNINADSIDEFKNENGSFVEFLNRRAQIQEQFDENISKKAKFEISDQDVEKVESSLSFILKLELSFDSILDNILNNCQMQTKSFDKKSREFFSNIINQIKNNQVFNSNRTNMIKLKIFYRNLMLELQAKELNNLSIDYLDRRALEAHFYCYSIPTSNITTAKYIENTLDSLLVCYESRKFQKYIEYLSFLLPLVSDRIFSKLLVNNCIKKILQKLNSKNVSTDLCLNFLQLIGLLLDHYKQKFVHENGINELIARLYDKCENLLTKIKIELKNSLLFSKSINYDSDLYKELSKLVQVSLFL